MDGRELKKIWRSGKPSFGAAITCADPAVAAVICNIGYQWVLIDAEHHPYNPESLRNILSMVNAKGVVSIVRVAENNAALIKQVLDWGAEGVMVPMLRTVEEAQQAAAACRYPPAGVRGFSPREASNYFKDLENYLATFNDRVIAMLQVEHIDAVNRIADFLKVPGLDAILIGPADLSFSLGHPLQPNHPEVHSAIDTTITHCNAAGIPVGTWAGSTAADQAEWAKRGLNFMIVGSDCDWIAQAGQAMLEELRQLTGGN